MLRFSGPPLSFPNKVERNDKNLIYYHKDINHLLLIIPEHSFIPDRKMPEYFPRHYNIFINQKPKIFLEPTNTFQKISHLIFLIKKCF